MPGNTPWSGAQSDKLYLQSGEFSATMKTSLSPVVLNPQDVAWDGTNSPWCASNDKLYLQSGQFSGTLKTSRDMSAIDSGVEGISWSNNSNNSPWCGFQSDKLYLQSGQFSATMKDSQPTGTVSPRGVSWDSADSPWCDDGPNKLFLQSGQFSATLKTSTDIGGIDGTITAIAWDQTNTPWAGSASDKLYLQSGQFSATLKTSLSVGGVDTDPRGIENTTRLAAAAAVVTPQRTLIGVGR